MAIQHKNKALGAAVILAALAFSSTASADASLATGGYSQLHTMAMMKMIDADGNHMVTKGEFTDYYGSVFDALDANKDGSIDAKEWVGTKGDNKISLATGGYSSQLRTLKTMKAMDTDSDHKVTKDEFLSYHDAIFMTMSKGGTEVDGKGWLARTTGN